MKIISACRLCKSSELDEAIDLGVMAFSGTFPSSSEEIVPEGQLRIVLCRVCKLAQLDRDFPQDEMYGENYGYMSSLNESMVNHLRTKSRVLSERLALRSSDIVVDIGSNDGTLLSSYLVPGIKRVAIDPTITKYRDRYGESTTLIADFFDADKYRLHLGEAKAKLVTTVAMLYDLPDPLKFAQEVMEILRPDGFWHIEVSYGPWMLESGAFDAICHEHTEYYSFFTLKSILDSAGFKIVECEFNEVNGGSITVTATPIGNSDEVALKGDEMALILEKEAAANTLESWRKFALLVQEKVLALEGLLRKISEDGKVIDALGASTKGNILLQALGSNSVSTIRQIGEVNNYKFGRFTPGTLIPIIPEEAVLRSKPDYLLVLPWHFKSSFKSRLAEYVTDGGSVIYPLPSLDVQTKSSLR